MYIFTEEHKNKISAAKKGKKRPYMIRRKWRVGRIACFGWHKTKTKSIFVNCIICTKPFKISPCHIKDGQKCCSLVCSRVLRKTSMPKGMNHYRWKKNRSFIDEKDRLRATIEWKNWRESVFQRDNYKCLDCGNGGYLEPHHIIPLRVDLKKIFDINNGITLCRPCHIKTLGKELELARTYFSLLPAQA